MISVEQAEQVVRERLTPWRQRGTFMIPAVYENDDFYAVAFCNRELVEGDLDYMILGNHPLIVSKKTGRIVNEDPEIVEEMQKIRDYTVGVAPA